MPKGRLNIVNRDDYQCFVPSPIEKYRTQTRIKSVRFVRTSPDEQYAKLKEKGLNIDISNPEIYVNGNKKPVDGIFSPMFGADTTQDTPIFTCECHHLTGGVNLGRICPDCNTEVRTIEADLRITGHIDIAPYHVLTYHGYTAFSKIFKNMNEIITTVRKINRAGKIVDNGIPTLSELYDDYDELYRDKIGLDKEIVFMTKIPVYSSRLRPLMHTGSTMTILDVNKRYLSIVNLANILKSTQLMPMPKAELEVQRTLNQLQQDFNDICSIVMDQVNSKSGVFRRALASGRLDNTSRLVIVLGRDLRAHEVDVPYRLMMVQYEEEIANRLAKLQNISISKAISLVEENQVERNEMFVRIINSLLRSGKGIWILDNRNPTISESGVQYVRIRKIHDDPNDMTLHLPQDVLALLAADFDGDQLTTAGCKNPIYHKLFLTMCPTYAYIDRADGRFNRAMGFAKDYSATIAAAWDIDTAYDRYLTNPDPDTDDMLRKIGLEWSLDNPEIEPDRNEIVKTLLSDDTKGSFKDRYVSPWN